MLTNGSDIFIEFKARRHKNMYTVQEFVADNNVDKNLACQQYLWCCCCKSFIICFTLLQQIQNMTV